MPGRTPNLAGQRTPATRLCGAGPTHPRASPNCPVQGREGGAGGGRRMQASVWTEGRRRRESKEGARRSEESRRRRVAGGGRRTEEGGRGSSPWTPRRASAPPWTPRSPWHLLGCHGRRSRTGGAPASAGFGATAAVGEEEGGGTSAELALQWREAAGERRTGEGGHRARPAARRSEAELGHGLRRAPRATAELALVAGGDGCGVPVGGQWPGRTGRKPELEVGRRGGEPVSWHGRLPPRAGPAAERRKCCRAPPPPPNAAATASRRPAAAAERRARGRASTSNAALRGPPPPCPWPAVVLAGARRGHAVCPAPAQAQFGRGDRASPVRPWPPREPSSAAATGTATQGRQSSIRGSARGGGGGA
ncbi:hypothetical protein PVAP13_5NG314825 [Panicum virgatum]|uniref:Uncharacterized protein n=1 Tax=Panicum virgatum TaxID=38727 RepID=A0A8T0RX30_PANVG|nr:hypothetical protein PVAP13_5NG314825 [Panicum virgatum]